MKRKSFIILIILASFTMFIFFLEKGMDVIRHGKKQYTVVIDAGHGGFDPGKIGVNRALEKNINLIIAAKLKNLLEQNDINVIMTRDEDIELCRKTDSNMKRADLQKRVSIINTSDAVFAVSIHQNSFTQESSWGAQVFYYNKSEEGKILAETIQETMKKSLNDGNHRLAKANGTYFMLKYSNCPLVIVECGFLSNRAEADLLCQEVYQDKLAWAIHIGIMEYIHRNNKDEELPLVYAPMYRFR